VVVGLSYPLARRVWPVGPDSPTVCLFSSFTQARPVPPPPPPPPPLERLLLLLPFGLACKRPCQQRGSVGHMVKVHLLRMHLVFYDNLLALHYTKYCVNEAPCVLEVNAACSRLLQPPCLLSAVATAASKGKALLACLLAYLLACLFAGRSIRLRGNSKNLKADPRTQKGLVKVMENVRPDLKLIVHPTFKDHIVLQSCNNTFLYCCQSINILSVHTAAFGVPTACPPAGQPGLYA
jgi:hypothetical protein